MQRNAESKAKHPILNVKRIKNRDPFDGRFAQWAECELPHHPQEFDGSFHIFSLQQGRVVIATFETTQPRTLS